MFPYRSHYGKPTARSTLQSGGDLQVRCRRHGRVIVRKRRGDQCRALRRSGNSGKWHGAFLYRRHNVVVVYLKKYAVTWIVVAIDVNWFWFSFVFDAQEEGWLIGIKESTGEKKMFPANFTRPLWGGLCRSKRKEITTRPNILKRGFWILVILFYTFMSLYVYLNETWSRSFFVSAGRPPLPQNALQRLVYNDIRCVWLYFFFS